VPAMPVGRRTVRLVCQTFNAHVDFPPAKSASGRKTVGHADASILVANAISGNSTYILSVKFLVAIAAA
jgi:hypothetical protein